MLTCCDATDEILFYVPCRDVQMMTYRSCDDGDALDVDWLKPCA